MIATTATELSESKKKRKNTKSNQIGINTIHFDRKESDRIGIALNSVFKIERLYDSIVDITTKVLEVKSASLMILEGNALRIKSSKHIPEKVMKQCRVEVGVGISGWVALKVEPLLVKNVEKDDRFKRRNNKRYSNKSFISVPVVYSGRVIGVINVNDKNNNESFGEKDVELLKIISEHSAIAIRNALLIRKSKKLTIVEKLDNYYNNDENKFLPVTLQSLKSGPFSTSELYIENGNNAKKRYVLYWKGGDVSTRNGSIRQVLDNEKRGEFIKKNINRLFVEKNGREQYLRFMEANLERIAEDNDVSLKEKFRVINDVAINLIKDVSAAPDRSCKIERAKHWVSIVTNVIFNNQNHVLGMYNATKHNGHSCERITNVTVLGLIFAYKQGLDVGELNKLGMGLFLQDIGMRKIDPLVVDKSTKLSQEEFQAVKKHSEIGFHMLHDTDKVVNESCLPALLHHENYDGSGYPYGLKGNKIDYFGRLSRVIDVFSALTCNRPYASINSPDKACGIMRDNMKGAFDPDILDSFIYLLISAKITTGTTSFKATLEK
ncbi:MAG: GAF domain-containing protein [Candidatus Scalindua sediminis]|nr:GAF domain-containing protein [Candidatus Scalindua sediminis]